MNLNLDYATNQNLEERIEAMGSSILSFAALVNDKDKIALTFSKEELMSLGSMLKLYVRRNKSDRSVC